MRFGFSNPMSGHRGLDGSVAGGIVFNARSETVDEKGMWKTLLHKKRCVIMADGFFEFHTELNAKTGEPARKQVYFFHMPLADGQKTSIIHVGNKTPPTDSPFPVMYLAAVYDTSVDSSGAEQFTCCILTCAPSKEMRAVHSRMPVVLSPEDARQWVDVDQRGFEDVRHLMKPYEGLSLYPVSSTVNNSRNHSRECIEPLAQFEARQKANGIARFFTSAPSAANKKTVVDTTNGDAKRKAVTKEASQIKSSAFTSSATCGAKRSAAAFLLFHPTSARSSHSPPPTAAEPDAKRSKTAVYCRAARDLDRHRSQHPLHAPPERARVRSRDQRRRRLRTAFQSLPTRVDLLFQIAPAPSRSAVRALRERDIPQTRHVHRSAVGTSSSAPQVGGGGHPARTTDTDRRSTDRRTTTEGRGDDALS